MPGNTLSSRINRVWRWFATVLSFSIFGVGSLLMGLLLVPYFWLTVRPASLRKQKLRHCVGKGMRFFVRVLKFLQVLDYRIDGSRHVIEAKNVLILANHPSLIDVVFLLALFPDAQCIIKKAIWANPFTALLIGRAGYISNAEPEELLVKAEAALAGGESLILFPEGTRTEPDSLPEFKLGAAAIAVRSAKDILPVIIRVTPTTLTKSNKWYTVPDSKVMMDMKIFPPLKTAGLTGELADRRQQTRMLNQRLQKWFRDELSVAK